MDITEKKLYEAALNAAERAYAPYSHFHVGAAVLMEDGTVVTGNNQENASYPEGMCAERVAVNYAKSQYPKLRVRAIALASPSTAGMVSPCGACRQVLAEVAARQSSDFSVIMQDGSGGLVEKSVSELLPLAFKF